MPLSPPSFFAGIDPATLATWLARAQAAYFALLSGTQVVEVVSQGDVVKYSRANIGDLQTLISQLQAAIAGRPTAGAIGVLWAD